MVPWWKRLIFSLLSGVVAGAAVGAGWYSMGGLLPAGSPFELDGLEAYAVMVFLSSLPALLLAVPMVLAIRNYRGFRLGWILPLGCSIGPLWIGMLEFYRYTTNMPGANFVGTDPVVWKVATAVSVLATSIYVLLVRWGQIKQNGDAESASPVN